MDGHILNKRFACPLADEMAKHTQNGGKLFMWYVMQVRTGTEENMSVTSQFSPYSAFQFSPSKA